MMCLSSPTMSSRLVRAALAWPASRSAAGKTRLVGVPNDPPRASSVRSQRRRPGRSSRQIGFTMMNRQRSRLLGHVSACRLCRTGPELDGVLLARTSSPDHAVRDGGSRRTTSVDRTDCFEHLVASDTETVGPYKGNTSDYWSVHIAHEAHAPTPRGAVTFRSAASHRSPASWPSITSTSRSPWAGYAVPVRRSG